MTILIEATLLGVLAGVGAVSAADAENTPRRGTVARGGFVASGVQGGVAVEALVEAVRADASRYASTAPEQVKLVSADSVTWSDGSLGCPQPGRSYTQALVAGWRIRVEAHGEVLDYHASQRGQWVWCPAGRSQDPAPDAVIR